jgi:hypothetical protein
MPLIRISRGLRHGVKLVSNLISRRGLILRVKSSLSLKGAVLSRTYVPLAWRRKAMAALAAASRLALHQSPKRKQTNGWLKTCRDLPMVSTACCPAVNLWGANQQAALISWAFNVGLGAVESSTLRKRLLAGEPGIMVVPQELLRWDKANGKSLAGLTRRRAAEVALFAGKPPLQQSAPRFTPSSPFTTLITPHITYGEVCAQ